MFDIKSMDDGCVISNEDYSLTIDDEMLRSKKLTKDRLIVLFDLAKQKKDGWHYTFINQKLSIVGDDKYEFDIPPISMETKIAKLMLRIKELECEPKLWVYKGVSPLFMPKNANLLGLGKDNGRSYISADNKYSYWLDGIKLENCYFKIHAKNLIILESFDENTILNHLTCDTLCIRGDYDDIDTLLQDNTLGFTELIIKNYTDDFDLCEAVKKYKRLTIKLDNCPKLMKYLPLIKAKMTP